MLITYICFFFCIYHKSIICNGIYNANNQVFVDYRCPPHKPGFAELWCKLFLRYNFQAYAKKSHDNQSPCHLFLKQQSLTSMYVSARNVPHILIRFIGIFSSSMVLRSSFLHKWYRINRERWFERYKLRHTIHLHSIRKEDVPRTSTIFFSILHTDDQQ